MDNDWLTHTYDASNPIFRAAYLAGREGVRPALAPFNADTDSDDGDDAAPARRVTRKPLEPVATLA